MEKVVPEHISKTVWVDNIKLLATIAVVGIHVAAYGVATEYNAHDRANVNWWITNLYESMFRCCVPLFVMVSGALLLPQSISLSDFLKKRLKRILTPFIFWSLIYIAFHAALAYRDERGAFLHHLGPWLYTQLTQGAEYHLWYVYMIIGLYLFIPILQPWIKTATNKGILYFLGIWLVTLLLKQFTTLKTPLELSYFSGYIGYLVLGYCMAHRLELSAGIRKIAVLIIVPGFLLTCLGTYWYTKAAGSFSDKWYEFLTVNVFLIASGVYILIKGRISDSNHPVSNNLRNIVKQYGFSIYLSHPFVLIIMTYFNITYKLVTPLIGVPLCMLICLTISYALVYVISKLPYGKFVTG